MRIACHIAQGHMFALYYGFSHNVPIVLQFWSCYVSCSSEGTDAVRISLDQADMIHRFIDYYPDVFQFVDNADGEAGLQLVMW